MHVEEFFFSKSRMKILKLLIQLGQLNVSEIASRLGINYTTTIKHLKLLESEGILEQKSSEEHVYSDTINVNLKPKQCRN